MPFLFAILLSVAAFFALLLLLLVGLVKLAGRLLSSQDEASSGEEARLLQELNSRMGRLEKRIESLETIVTSAGRDHGNMEEHS
jgi:phage shock protein B